jgi:hypothetical protein
MSKRKNNQERTQARSLARLLERMCRNPEIPPEQRRLAAAARRAADGPARERLLERITRESMGQQLLADARRHLEKLEIAINTAQKVNRHRNVKEAPYDIEEWLVERDRFRRYLAALEESVRAGTGPFPEF